MSLFAIGDLHLSFGVNKPMNVFKGWDGYEEKLKESWNERISGDDTVVLCGDISWGMSFDEARADFDFINKLNGRKLILKGNHDYWWNTVTKMNAWLEAENFSTISFLHNNSCAVGNIAVCGTRGWLKDESCEQDEKVLRREAIRLRASLDSAEEGRERVVFLHYPPIYLTEQTFEITDVLREYRIDRCYYGHIHGDAIPYAVNKMRDGVEYRLVSADALNFCPLRVD